MKRKHIYILENKKTGFLVNEIFLTREKARYWNAYLSHGCCRVVKVVLP